MPSGADKLVSLALVRSGCLIADLVAGCLPAEAPISSCSSSWNELTMPSISLTSSLACVCSSALRDWKRAAGDKLKRPPHRQQKTAAR